MSRQNYEARDIPPKGAALALAGVLASLLLVGLIVAALLGWIATNHPPQGAVEPARPPAPRLQVSPQAERIRIETAAKARLKGDASHPSIEEAMRIVAAEGWHDRLPAPPVPEIARAHSGAGQ